MSVYLRIVVRLAILSTLVLGMVALYHPVKADAFSCVGNCFQQKNACLNKCGGDPTCRADCNEIYQVCVAACCSKPGIC